MFLMIFTGLKRKKMSPNKIIFFLILLFVSNLSSLTFAWLTDLHVETDLTFKKDNEIRYSLSVNLLKKAIKKINQNENISMVLITGDLVNSAKSWNLDVAKDLLSNLNVPYFVVIGNNDFSLPTDGVGTGKFDFHLIFSRNEPNLRNGIWQVIFKHFLLIGIDNINPLDGSMVFKDKQLEILEKAISKRKKFIKGIIILLHYPIVDFNYKTKGEVQIKAKKFLEICNKYHVDLILSGHYHYNEYQLLNDTYNFIQSSLAVYPHQFSIITIDEKQIVLKKVDVANDFILSESKKLLEQTINRDGYNGLLKKLLPIKRVFYYERRK